MIRRRLLLLNNNDADISIPNVYLSTTAEPENFTIDSSDLILYNPPGDYEHGVMYPIHNLIAYYENNYLTLTNNVLNLYNREFVIDTYLGGGIIIHAIAFVNDRITIVGMDEQENPWHGTIVNEFTEIQIDGGYYSVLPGSVYFKRLFPVTESQQYRWTNSWIDDNGVEFMEEYIICRDSNADSYSIPSATALVEWYNIAIGDNNLDFTGYSEYSLTIHGESGRIINVRDMYGYDDDNYDGNISINGIDNYSYEWSGYLAIRDGSVTIDTGLQYPVYTGDIVIHRIY